MLTLGIDMASAPKDTGTCLLRWHDGGVSVEQSETIADDEVLRDLISKVDFVGIDVPLGWPRSFTKAVNRWAAGEKWLYQTHEPAKRRPRLRLTDRLLECKDPLSVSADRIAVPAFRAAALLSAIDLEMPRDGSQKIVEVYPFASLEKWFGSDQVAGYKRPDATHRRGHLLQAIVSGLGRTPANFERFRARCLECDDHLDAFVAALTARAAKRGLTNAPNRRQQLIARTEGWIHVPRQDSLSQLCGAGRSHV